MLNTYHMLIENHPTSADMILNTMRGLMTFDKLNLDLPSISKLFALNAFENINLKQFPGFRSCFKHVIDSNSHDDELTFVPGNDAFFQELKEDKNFDRSPCKNITKYPECTNYCLWHEDLISNKLSKDDFLDLMR